MAELCELFKNFFGGKQSKEQKVGDNLISNLKT